MATNYSVSDPASDGSHADPARPLATDWVIGLQLMRASTMASTRLQLAVARRDRPQALSAIDMLLDVDAEIERLATSLDADGREDDLASITEWIGVQKAAIASEKFGLACGVAGAGLVSPPDRLGDGTPGSVSSDANSLADESLDADEGALTAQRALSTRYWWVLLLLVVAAAVAIIVSVGVGKLDLQRLLDGVT